MLVTGGFGGGFLCEWLEFEINGVGPAEADDILAVSGGDFEMLCGVDDVVFLEDVAGLLIDATDGGVELVGDAGGIGAVSGGEHALDGDPGSGGPSVGKVPLDAGVVGADGEASGVVEVGDMREHALLLGAVGGTGPERVKGSEEEVIRLTMGEEVVVEIYFLPGVPEVTVDGSAAGEGLALPLCGLGRMVEGPGHPGEIDFVFV